MTLPVPTLAFVESRQGKYHGHFAYPVKDEELPEYHAFRHPRNHLRHEVVIRNRVVVFSLPHSFKRNEWNPPDLIRDEESPVTSKPHPNTKKRKAKKEETGP